jgi:hypothetical protein
MSTSPEFNKQFQACETLWKESIEQEATAMPPTIADAKHTAPVSLEKSKPTTGLELRHKKLMHHITTPVIKHRKKSGLGEMIEKVEDIHFGFSFPRVVR